MDKQELSISELTLTDIENFLSALYLNGASGINGGETVKYATLRDYIEVISSFYEYIVLSGYPYSPSLLVPTDSMALLPERKSKTRVKKKGEHLTKIHLLSKLYKPTKADIPQVEYTKWYSPEEIHAIAGELDITCRCIFLITVYTGFRIDSALSVTTETVDIAAQTIRPTRSKTGKMHTALIPEDLADDLMTYLIEIRSKLNPTSNAFFISKNGTPLSYMSYRLALENARIAVNSKYGWNIKALHSHAGRSTFAAALRSYQLEQRRKGIPTFSDVDFCNLMDWKSLSSLEHYDLTTRVQDVSPLLLDFYNNFESITAENSDNSIRNLEMEDE